MNYILMPSLKHIAILKIAIALWNQRNVRFQVESFDFSSLNTKKREYWQKVEDEVIKLASNLSLPESLKKEVLRFIKPIGLEIWMWKEHASAALNDKDQSYIGIIDLLKEVCWTSQGTVDRKKTAEILIKDENIDVTRRYRLACAYCLEDDVRELWNSMSQRERDFFYGKGHPNFGEEHVLVKFWTYDIERKVGKLNSLIKKVIGERISAYLFAFEYATIDSNKAATEYFLQKLTHGDREKYLVMHAGHVAERRSRVHNSTKIPKEYYGDVLCFLLSQMNGEQQVRVFREYPEQVLRCLLDWPWQRFFMETANRLWAFLPERDFFYFLKGIVDKVRLGYKDWNYKNLFREFWQESPNTFKKYVLVRCAENGYLLSDLLKIEHKENVRLILKNATVQERERIIFNDAGKTICDNVINSGNWDLLKFFIQECISSEDKMIKFKEEVESPTIYNRLTARLEREKCTKDKFFQLFDDLIQKDDKKRDMEKGNSSPAKRLCSLTSGQINSS